MKIDGVPGLTIHEHEGRLAGTFELPPADLAAITFDGRVMLVLIADVGVPFSVVTTKDGNHRARWTFKAVDAALVRDQGMRGHLENALYLDGSGIAPHVLDEEDEDEIDLGPELNALYPPGHRTSWSITEEDLTLISPTTLGPLPAGKKVNEDFGGAFSTTETVEGEEVIERFGDPITIPGTRERPARPDRIVHAFDPDHDPSDRSREKALDDFLWKEK